jgi:poly-beta-1,6-N-acetyl-D-glucosamine biosynthesis protein PgaD
MIIDGRQKKGTKKFEILLTWVGWSYMIGAFLQITATLAMWVFNVSFEADNLFNIDNIYYTLRVTTITLGVAIISFLILFLWSEYNYKRYSKLKRRRFSGIATNEELASYFKIELRQIEEMQQSKYVEFDKTIV